MGHHPCVTNHVNYFIFLNLRQWLTCKSQQLMGLGTKVWLEEPTEWDQSFWKSPYYRPPIKCKKWMFFYQLQVGKFLDKWLMPNIFHIWSNGSVLASVIKETELVHGLLLWPWLLPYQKINYSRMCLSRWQYGHCSGEGRNIEVETVKM